MGKTRVKRKRRRKTRRGGDPDEVRRILEEIDRQVFNGFYDRAYEHIDGDDLWTNGNTVDRGKLQQKVTSMMGHLRRFSEILTVIHRYRDDTARDGLPLDYTFGDIQNIRGNLLSNLQRIGTLAESIPNGGPLSREIREEVAYLNDKFDKIERNLRQV